MKKMACSKLVVTRHLERIADQLQNKTPFLTCTRWKLYFLISKKHHRNWLVGNPVETQLDEFVDLDERRLISKMTDDHIAGVESFSPGQHFLLSVFNRITGETGYCRYSHSLRQELIQYKISVLDLRKDLWRTVDSV